MAADDYGGGRESAGVTMRTLRPSDHGAVIAVVDDWWGGRPMAAMLPRLFFEHFADTSFAADRAGALVGRWRQPSTEWPRWGRGCGCSCGPRAAGV
jgi:hypothetical protein